jgi:hypothetical protein
MMPSVFIGPALTLRQVWQALQPLDDWPPSQDFMRPEG